MTGLGDNLSAPERDGAFGYQKAATDCVRRRREVEELLRNALEHNKFEVYYQPMCTVRNDRFMAAEALLRLKDKDGHNIPPDEFIPVAEATGMIVEIGNTVLKKVCLYIKYLKACGIGLDSISVNLSVAQLMDEGAVPALLGIIRESGVSPARILFEITESILIRNYGLIGEKIRQLSREGIRFALDDFGTGYSNISHVIDLPFDVVKIDKSLVWDSVKNRRCHVLVRDLIHTFKNIDLSVTAEGIETEEQGRFVRNCGCDQIQGFRYARPLPVSGAGQYFGRRAAV